MNAEGIWWVAWVNFYKSAQINSPSSQYSDILPTWRMPPKNWGHTLTKNIPAHLKIYYIALYWKLCDFPKIWFFAFFWQLTIIIHQNINSACINYLKTDFCKIWPRWNFHSHYCKSQNLDGRGFFIWGCGLQFLVAFFKLVKCLNTVS